MHPNIVIPPEEDILVKFYPYFRRSLNEQISRVEIERMLGFLFEKEKTIQNWHIDRASLAARIAALPSRVFVEVVKAFYAELLSRFPKKTRWGCKMPFYALWLDVIWQLLPEARVVHVVRDGRDVYLSMQDRRARGARNFPRTVLGAAVLWESYVGAARSFGRDLGGGRYLEVSYEALLEDPGSGFREICGFVGEEFAPEMLDYYSGSLEKKLIPSDNVPRYLKKTFDPGNIAKWKREMSAFDVALFEASAGSMLGLCGYPLEGRSYGGLPKLMSACFAVGDSVYRRSRSLARSCLGPRRSY